MKVKIRVEIQKVLKRKKIVVTRGRLTNPMRI